MFEVRKAICTSKTLWSRVEIYEMCSGPGFQCGGPDLCYRCSFASPRGFFADHTQNSRSIDINFQLYIVCGPSARIIFIFAEPVSLFVLSGLTVSAGTPAGMLETTQVPPGGPRAGASVRNAHLGDKQR